MNDERPLGRTIAPWALAYLLAHVLGVVFTDPVRHVAAIWPASGVTLAALLSAPRRRWPALVAVLGAIGFFTNVTMRVPIAMSFAFCFANSVDAVLGSWLITRVCGRPITFSRLNEILALAMAAALVNALTALAGAAAPALVAAAPFWASYRTWWISNLLGVVVVAPLLLAWTGPPPLAAKAARRAERLGFSLAWCVAVWVISSAKGPRSALSVHPYMLVCLLPWAALRLGMRTVTAATGVLAAGVIGSAVSGRIHRDFEAATLPAGTMQVQLFVALAALTGLLLCASTTEVLLARRAADRSTGQLALALDAAGMGAWEWEVAADRVYWSEGVARTFGVPLAEFDGKLDTYISLIHPEDRELVSSGIREAIDEGREFAVEHRIVRPVDGLRWVACRGRMFRDEMGKVSRMAGTVMDITLQRQVEQHLRESQKMDAIGQLAGGVAHDFNNILSAILTQAEIGRARLGGTPLSHELLDEIVFAAERGSALTRQLLAFARKQIMDPKAVDLNLVVSEHSTMLRRLLGEQIHLRVELAGGSLATRADPAMLGQVLMNLALNARDAMEAGGDMTISTEAIVLSNATPTASGEAPPGAYHALRVIDTGTGVAPENLARLFEPFFTTKPAERGTGLGLATVFGIVKLHNAFIRVTSQVGRGSTFEILFRPTDEKPASPSPRPAPREPAGGATILLVEDDRSVRRTTRMLLEMEGYEVVEAATGAEALRVWDDHGDRIRLLFTDLTLPGGMKGGQLAAELRSRSPRLEVILTTGYSAELAGRELEPGDRFLMKPTPPQEMLAAVRRALAAHESPRQAEGVARAFVDETSKRQ